MDKKFKKYSKCNTCYYKNSYKIKLNKMYKI